MKAKGHTVARLVAAGLIALSGAARADGTRPFDRHYNHYHDSFVYKVFVKSAVRDKPDISLDRATNLIARIAELSGGLHQIPILVGCTAEGLDSEYPDWSRIGSQCKSSYSDDPTTSLRRMMRDCRKYNADVTLHLNMSDAYTNSPLWRHCVDGNLLCRATNGLPIPGNEYNGLRCYHICHTKSLRSGFAKRQILDFLKMVPELREAGTVHIDTFCGRGSPYDGIDDATDARSVNEIISLWHEQGIDVTGEFLPSEDHVGYLPMVIHLNTDEFQRIKYPPDVLCGGNDTYNTRDKVDIYQSSWKDHMPGAGCRFEEAWGRGHWDDFTPARLRNERQFVRNLFHYPFLFVYYNRARVARYGQDLTHYFVERANGVRASVRIADRSLTVTDNGRTVVEGGDFFLDFPHNGGVILAYSEKGCNRRFRLPKGAPAAGKLVGKTYPGGEPCSLGIADSSVVLTLPAGHSAVFVGCNPEKFAVRQEEAGRRF